MTKDKNKPTSRIGKFLFKLTEPVPGITDLQQKRQVRLLSYLLLVIISGGSVSAILQLLTVPGFLSTFLAILGTITLMLIAYSFTRTRHYLVAAVITCLTPSLACYAALLANPQDQSTFGFLLIGVLLSSMLLNRWYTAGIAALNLSGLLLLPLLQPAWTYPIMSGIISYHVIIPALIIISTWNRDLLERDRQEKLRRSEERFRDMAENIEEVFYLSDLKAPSMLYISPGYEKIWGRSCQSLYENPISFLEAVHPEDRDRVLAYLDHQRQGDGAQEEYRVIRPDGTVRWVWDRSVPIRDSEGWVSRMCGVVQDITERKQAEVERARLLNVLEASLNEIYMFDPRTLKFHYVNRGAIRNLGYTLEQLRAMTPLDLKPEFTEASFREMIKPFLRREKDRHVFQTVHRRADGSLYPVEVHLQLVESAGVRIFLAIILDITERKQAEEKLRRSEDRYRIVTELMSDYIFRLDIDTDGKATIGYLSENYDEITGHTLDQVKFTETWSSIIHPEDVGMVMNRLRAVIATRQSAELECRSYVKDGKQRWVYVVARPMVDQNSGAVTEIVGSVKDISARKQAEEKLRDNETRMKKILESIKDGFFTLDKNGYYTYVNAHAAASSGTTPDVLLGKRIWDLFPNAKESILWRSFQKAMMSGQDDINFDIYYEPYDKWYDYTMQPLEDGVSVHFREITDKKRAEEALRKSEAHLEEAQRIAHLGSWDWIAATDTPTWSRELCAILEVDPDQPVPSMAEQDKLYTPDSMVRMRTSVERTMQTGTPYEIELERVREDGTRRWLLARGERWFDGSGQLIGLHGTALDITVLKRAEEELLLSHNRLAELSRRLVEAHETERRAIGRELHDQFGQMLTAMKITLDLVRELPRAAAAKKIDQAQELASDLLNRVSRLSLELRPPMLDDLGLLPALLWHINRHQEQTGIEVDFRHGGLEGQRFDREIETTVYRLIQESLTNVARHAHATRASLEVRVRGGSMEIQIGDNGQGFDPQAAFALNRGLGGMRERVSLLGGSLQVESQVGKGTRMSIQLPLGEENQ